MDASATREKPHTLASASDDEQYQLTPTSSGVRTQRQAQSDDAMRNTVHDVGSFAISSHATVDASNLSSDAPRFGATPSSIVWSSMRAGRVHRCLLLVTHQSCEECTIVGYRTTSPFGVTTTVVSQQRSNETPQRRVIPRNSTQKGRKSGSETPNRVHCSRPSIADIYCCNSWLPLRVETSLSCPVIRRSHVRWLRSHAYRCIAVDSKTPCGWSTRGVSCPPRAAIQLWAHSSNHCDTFHCVRHGAITAAIPTALSTSFTPSFVARFACSLSAAADAARHDGHEWPGRFGCRLAAASTGVAT
jgi:hypothetical protein